MRPRWAAGRAGADPADRSRRAPRRSCARGNYLIKNGAVITVDPALGVLPRADVHVRNGRIEAIGPDLAAAGAEMIDATDMIVMPGFVDTHYHMWSALGRNFVGDGFGYFPAKNATSKLFTRGRLLRQRHARPGRAGQRRHHHRAQLVAQHAHACACRRRAARAPRVDAARPLRLRPRRPDAAQRAARLHRRRPRASASISPPASAFEGLVTSASTCAACRRAMQPTFLTDMAGALRAQAADRDARRPDAAQLASTPRTSRSAAGSARIC